jgi:hypothetical protein
VGTIFVARSKALSQWGYDVGLSKHLYKVGYTDRPVQDVIAEGWAGETDWTLVKKQDGVDGTGEDEIVERLAKKQKMVEPRLYPRIKETTGIFKITESAVQNHILIKRALAGDPEFEAVKVKAGDFADFLIVNGLG